MACFQCNVTAPSLNMIMQSYVVLPDDITPEKKKEIPVIYLLHGLSDNASGWTRFTSIERHARAYGAAVIMPEVQRSFYTDMEYGLNYFEYITKDLKAFARNFFDLPTDREHSYIAGLSMGGYGAVKAALRLPEEYAACAGFSSACDIREFLEKDMLFFPGEAVAIYGTDLILKPEDDVFALAQGGRERPLKPRVFLSCGTDDLLYPHTQKLKKALEENDYPLSYWECKEDHTWNFWDMSVQRALSFFLSEDKVRN